ncbi:suppressor of fused domain protein [Corynebacterium comes]|uniref:Suppressor of fused protein (SUFU) n=1 Tax=Corynebacterium comes TaxID=2675218 RepID=A0A6B8VE72_9CORY|nr:suppressor of fused domain protein [Corynebacterium comes]QGU03542.1 Suppressor of fused protein (SUFU) [Corynebacterium comes]
MDRAQITHWFDQLIPAELEFRADSAVADLGEGQRVALTVGFSDVDTGLVAVDGGEEVRSELILVARAEEQQLADTLAAAATMLSDVNGILPAQPGTMLPNLAGKAGLQDVSVMHGLFVPPYLWGGETPRFTEGGRLTVLLQLVMLTDAEYAYAVEEGPGGLQQALGEAGIDLLDWRR